MACASTNPTMHPQEPASPSSPMNSPTSSRSNTKRRKGTFWWLFGTMLVVSFVGGTRIMLRAASIIFEPNDSDPHDSYHPALEQRMSRTAVVWTTIGVVTKCEAQRLLHLVETSGVDVWVLYAHHELWKQRGSHHLVKVSRDYMKSIPGLQTSPQSRVRYIPFDGSSGSAKSSFIRFLADHPQYDFAWNIENDMFFTGPWQEILESEMERDHTTDFLTSVNYMKNASTPWFHFRKCLVFGRRCSDVKRRQLGWMFARVSRNLAKSLKGDLMKKRINGHHEAVLGAYCHLKNFTFGSIDRSRVGELKCGHTNNKTADAHAARLQNVGYYKPKPGVLIHPVKCDAYTHDKNRTMQDDIDEWTSRDETLS